MEHPVKRMNEAKKRNWMKRLWSFHILMKVKAKDHSVDEEGKRKECNAISKESKATELIVTTQKKV